MRYWFVRERWTHRGGALTPWSEMNYIVNIHPLIWMKKTFRKYEDKEIHELIWFSEIDGSTAVLDYCYDCVKTNGGELL